MARTVSPKNDVYFRLPPAYIQDLEKRKDERAVKSRHLVAKYILMDAMNNTEARAVREELAHTRRELRRLRNDFVHLAVNLFVHAGKLDSEQARQWVESNFGTEE